jgi:uncharacterized protein (DUF924 family)
MNSSIQSYQAVIQFWFEETEPKYWFKKDADFDDEIRNRFLSSYQAAIRCELFEWRQVAEGRLAEIIVLDQFSRNMFRDAAQAFSFDSLAVSLTQEAVAGGWDKELPIQKRSFLYMPLMHSESLVIHKQAKKLFFQPGLENYYEYELKHQAIIKKFGRYPHRNKALVRDSTVEEIEFLRQPGSSF